MRSGRLLRRPDAGRHRFGSYKYLDMHRAIGAALKTFEHEVEPFFARGDMRPGDAAARRTALSPLPA
ncbi:hypothetical protein [Bradyrhizobium sp. CCBAU 53421]|uniref:hypothetical protein n=1 Tax=Bradyrhizobium sp. CCBAU 53421 TaxID=1325120 RepID=UPI00188D3943|nr:hypothetical protein [Bradyrhizobium sp. CCBAU 53421]QOZ36875.1 hypothetical protein XH92_39390 [Bradyrhizobium sp. CCBAU 53421]